MYMRDGDYSDAQPIVEDWTITWQQSPGYGFSYQALWLQRTIQSAESIQSECRPNILRCEQYTDTRCYARNPTTSIASIVAGV